jgi:polyisoprenoid-binding protein YceI
LPINPSIYLTKSPFHEIFSKKEREKQTFYFIECLNVYSANLIFLKIKLTQIPMKKLGFLLSIGLLAATIGCGNSSDADKAQAADAGKAAEVTQGSKSFTIDNAASSVNWTGFGVGHKHFGTIGVKEGSVSVENGNVTAGKFVFDMKQIEAKDSMPEDKRKNLLGHLSSSFFMTDSFPTSTFEITKVEPLQGKEGATHTVSGNLTMKGSTKQLAFPANIAVNGNEVSTTATFQFDRTLWDVIENSKKNPKFDLKKFANHAVEDNVEMTLNIKAKAQ